METGTIRFRKMVELKREGGHEDHFEVDRLAAPKLSSGRTYCEAGCGVPTVTSRSRRMPISDPAARAACFPLGIR
jgi:hypothetical protein